ncbi:hypothetical protein GL218_07176 [Daldinia childiae]|uniref:uncharacterized protein n=1 Tax=Daldinia childiae TaxID=326645 RepID=UPI001447E8E4|nr:uncharacterized protein GL218_07176 [Daldinia childiae]KAF3055695.1 hypothetical protein GL218_07176 [Daldinia childiae]
MKAEPQEQQSGASCGYQQSYPAVNSTTANASASSTQVAQAVDLEKLEQRRRLDEIVKDHIDDFGIVYDRPGPEIPGDSPDGSWMMAGGLVTDPLQVQGLWDVRMSTSSLSSSGEDNNNDERKVASQEISSLAEASTFQGDNRATLPNDIHNTVKTSSFDPSTAASPPMPNTMQAWGRQSSNPAHPTQIRGSLPPQYFDRVTPTTFRGDSQMDGPAQEEADIDGDDYYAGPVNGNPFGTPTSYSTAQPQSQTQSGLRPASPPIPQPIDDLVVLVGVPGVGVPGTSSSRHCQGRCINREFSLAEALARDRMVLDREEELWTMMMGF